VGEGGQGGHCSWYIGAGDGEAKVGGRGGSLDDCPRLCGTLDDRRMRVWGVADA
jgi:hypothetical protein